MSSACERMTDRASSSSGYPLSTSVTASGWVWRMALTTVKPSPACGICRSESSTSKFSVAIRWSASRTPTTATTSNPSRSSAVCNIWRTASSSSASKILSTFTAFSLPAEKCCTSGFPADYEIPPTLSVQNCSAGDAQALTRLVP